MPSTGGKKRKATSDEEDNSEDVSDNNSAESDDIDDECSVISESSTVEETKGKPSSKSLTLTPTRSPKGKATTKIKIKGSTTESAQVVPNGKVSNASAIAPTTVPLPALIADGPPISTDAAAKKFILQYMKQQNRPYSLLQIFENLRKRVPKPTLERVLGVMSGPGGELLAKEYGKSKIFYMDQSFLSSSLGTSASAVSSLEVMQEENSILQEEVGAFKSQVKSLVESVVHVTQDPSDEDIDGMLLAARLRTTEKRTELGLLKKRVESIPDSMAFEKIIQRHNYLRQAWSERKILCLDVVDQLAEALGKKRKTIMDDLSLETDEEHHQQLPPLIRMK